MPSGNCLVETEACTSTEDEQIITFLRQLVIHFQRAAVSYTQQCVTESFLCLLQVLSHRGYCWVILVNACRGLWNALTILRKSINSENKSTSKNTSS